MPSGEISTVGIVQHAFNHEKAVFIPYTYKQSDPKPGEPLSIMDMLQLQSMSDYQSLQPDKWGIPTPSKDTLLQRENSFGGQGPSEGSIAKENQAEDGLDLIVMPGMAFDENYARLGHGKGFYDFFLERCHQNTLQNEKAKMPFLGES